MLDKKKTVAVKTNTERRMGQSQAAKNATPGEPAPTPPLRTPKDSNGSNDIGGPPNATRQLAAFEAGMRLFHARKMKDARERFVEAAAGPGRDVAQRATLHIAMCDRRLEQAPVNMGSAEDYYNYGVAMLNSRNVAEARTHLEKALAIAPGADHIHYALALAQALSGDATNAYQNLKRAIDLEPRNRIIARQDADFGPLASQPPFDTLLYPDKKSGW